MRAHIAVVSGFVLAAALTGMYAQRQPVQATDENGAPIYKVDPFWPKPLPNRWSMQQVTGIWVDHLDHIWFLNRPEGEIGRAHV